MGRKALSREERLDRTERLRDSARDLYRTTSYDAIRIADIAQNIGIAKATAFLYFPSKEELMASAGLALLLEWFAEFQFGDEAVADTEAFLRRLSKSIVKHPQLPRITGDMFQRILPALDPERKREASIPILSIIHEGGQLLQSWFPYLEEGTGYRIFARILSMIPLRGMQDSWETLQKSLDQPLEEPAIAATREHASYGSDFFIHSVRRLLKGYSVL